MPIVADLKAYLRIESSAEDALLAALLVRASAMVEAWIDTPIGTEEQTAVDRAESLARVVVSLVFPRRPCAVTSVTSAAGVVVPATTYTVDGTSGVIYANRGESFPAGPYTIVADVGLAVRADYARIEPLIAVVVLDLAADLYQRRTPGATTETSAGTTVQWDASRETVARVLKTLRVLKLGVAQ